MLKTESYVLGTLDVTYDVFRSGIDLFEIAIFFFIFFFRCEYCFYLLLLFVHMCHSNYGHSLSANVPRYLVAGLAIEEVRIDESNERMAESDAHIHCPFNMA